MSLFSLIQDVRSSRCIEAKLVNTQLWRLPGAGHEERGGGRVNEKKSLTLVIVLPDKPNRTRNRLRSGKAIHIPPRADNSKDPPFGIMSDPSRFVFIERDRLDVDLPNRVQLAENDAFRSRHRQQGGGGGTQTFGALLLESESERCSRDDIRQVHARVGQAVTRGRDDRRAFTQREDALTCAAPAAAAAVQVGQRERFSPERSRLARPGADRIAVLRVDVVDQEATVAESDQ